MDSTLNIAIAAEFELAEKIAEALEMSSLAINKLSIIEITPFNDEQAIRFNNKSTVQLLLDETNWEQIDCLFFAGNIEHVPQLVHATQAGCVVLDIKGICSHLEGIPIVVPGINEHQLKELRNRNIVSLPDPQVTQLIFTIAGLIDSTALSHILVTSVLPVSYIGSEQIAELAGQTAQLLNGIPLSNDQQRLAFDVSPINNQTTLLVQLQRIFPQLNNVSFHQIQAPVFYGLAQMITVLSDETIDSQHLLNYWDANQHIKYHANKIITPVSNGERESNEKSSALLHISALTDQEAQAFTNSLQFWVVSDAQRFTIIRMAIQLAESIFNGEY